jgi:hypothetical protein
LAGIGAEPQAVLAADRSGLRSKRSAARSIIVRAYFRRSDRARHLDIDDDLHLRTTRRW